MRDIVQPPQREDRMGFMDKAKKLAEQAQEKLDEAQKNFNKSDSPQAPAGDAVRYDAHGRPIPREEAPAAESAPAAEETPAGGPAPTAEEPAAPPPPASDANRSPDPFKPIE
jgi:hypothetical protein